jgi:hypothetical protein
MTEGITAATIHRIPKCRRAGCEKPERGLTPSGRQQSPGERTHRQGQREDAVRPGAAVEFMPCHQRQQCLLI